MQYIISYFFVKQKILFKQLTILCLQLLQYHLYQYNLVPYCYHRKSIIKPFFLHNNIMQIKINIFENNMFIPVCFLNKFNECPCNKQRYVKQAHTLTFFLSIFFFFHKCTFYVQFLFNCESHYILFNVSCVIIHLM